MWFLQEYKQKDTLSHMRIFPLWGWDGNSNKDKLEQV